MTSRTSNYNEIVSFLQSLQGEYKDLKINESEIMYHLDEMDSGNGIRILNSLSSKSMGVFLFNSNGFKLLLDNEGLSTLYQISNEDAINLLQRYYVCRFLAKVPKYYDDVIIAYNQELNELVNKIAAW